MTRERLRVVAVLDGPLAPAWVRHTLLDLASSECAELVGVVFAEQPRENPHGLSFRAYQAMDRRLFAQPNDPLTPVAVAPLLERCAFGVAPAEAHADLLLKLCAAPLPRAWSTATPRLGIWSFDHLESEARGGAPFFWEIARQLPVTETCLRARTASGSRVLVRSFASTDASSLARGRHAPLWKSAGFVARALRDAADPPQDGGNSFEPDSAALPERAPGPIEITRLGARVALRVAVERLRARTRSPCWFVALRHSQGSLVDGPMRGFAPLSMPGDRFYADPFLVPDGDRLWLFFEDADRASGKALIRCGAVLPDGSLGESRVVLECDYHLSYPFVFRSGDAWYMLPETSGHRTVELWRAQQFPWTWKLERVLLSDVKAVDATLLDHEGRLWLFAGLSETGGDAEDELFVFSSDSLGGEWLPHPRNPVVSDVRRARPAGPFFREGAHLYRPSQDCSGLYGRAIWINRVDRLDRNVYRETPVRRIAGDWLPGLVGTHTIQRAGGFDAIDGRVSVRNGTAFPS